MNFPIGALAGAFAIAVTGIGSAGVKAMPSPAASSLSPSAEGGLEMVERFLPKAVPDMFSRKPPQRTPNTGPIPRRTIAQVNSSEVKPSTDDFLNLMKQLQTKGVIA